MNSFITQEPNIKMKELFSACVNPNFLTYRYDVEKRSVSLTVTPYDFVARSSNIMGLLDTLPFDKYPIVGNLTELPAIKSAHCLNAARNIVAYKSRRSVGNIVICSLKTFEAIDKRLIKSDPFKFCELNLPFGHAFITYFSIKSVNPDKANVDKVQLVDGPFAWDQTTDKLYAQANWQNYFCRIDLLQ